MCLRRALRPFFTLCLALGLRTACAQTGSPAGPVGEPSAANSVGSAANAPGALVPRSADTRVQALLEKNSLLHEGLRPWHLSMSFTVYDLNGTPQENGTLEMWWAGPGRVRRIIQSPSYSDQEGTPPGSLRTARLIHDLTSQMTNPVQVLTTGTLTEETRTVGSAKVTCLSSSQTQLCADPATDMVRISRSPGRAAIRNKPAKFQGVMIGMEASIDLEGLKAISGHIEKLETFDVTKAGLTFPEPAKSEGHLNSVSAGKLLEKTEPQYPLISRMKHVQGTVMLCAIISKDGGMRNLDVLASPDVLLSGAAMEAVKHWKYQAYLLNGKPIEVETTVLVNFNVNGVPH